MDDWNKLSDRENFARIISAYADTVFRVSYQYVCNRQDAEDIVQEVFISLVERMRLCPFSDDEHLKAWLIRVAINKSINAAKRGARRRTVGIDNLPLSRRGEETQLDEELARLSADDRQVIYLHYYEGYSAKEIAQFMQINENAVHKRLSRPDTKNCTLKKPVTARLKTHDNNGFPLKKRYSYKACHRAPFSGNGHNGFFGKIVSQKSPSSPDEKR